MKRFGLPKACLLRKPREFEQVYRRGQRFRGHDFTLIAVANELPYNRLGVSMHGKLRGSVRRNRIKRMIKEVFRLHRNLFPRSCDIVFTVRPNFQLQTYESVKESVVRLQCQADRV